MYQSRIAPLDWKMGYFEQGHSEISIDSEEVRFP